MSRENVEVVRRMFEEWLHRNPRDEAMWRDARALLDAEFEYSEDPRWPGAATYKGLPAFREVVSGYVEALGEMRLEPERLFDAGDRVLVFINWWARGASGVEAQMRQAGIFTVRDGRVASWQVVFDREQALEAVGLRE